MCLENKLNKLECEINHICNVLNVERQTFQVGEQETIFPLKQSSYKRLKKLFKRKK